MKFLSSIILSLLAVNAFGNDVFVQGHTRSDGTYVAPHVRSSPDSMKWNNYGVPSSEDRQEQQSDIYQRDYDSDRTFNQYDYDDDNDGVGDDYEN